MSLKVNLFYFPYSARITYLFPRQKIEYFYGNSLQNAKEKTTRYNRNE